MTHDPALKLDAIQGIAIPGFFKPHQALLSLRLRHGPSLRAVTDVLLELLDNRRISSGAAALRDRRLRHRRPDDPPLLAVGLSANGLDMLSNRLQLDVASTAFRQGMPSRARLLGDPDPAHWKVGGERIPDLLLVVAGNSDTAVRTVAQDLVQRLPRSIFFDSLLGEVQHGSRLPGEPHSREHFGFADGVSQPAIRGTWRGRPITRRELDPSDREHDLFGRPGQHLVWPGEFVLGYPASSPDPRLPGPVRLVPTWMHNGSFLVYRRLQQHVEAFQAEMRSEAERLRKLAGFSRMDEGLLAAKLVGRWPSGAPVSRAPDGDNPALGNERWMNNDFRFDDPTPQRTFPAGTLPPALQALPPARADILGQVCPVASHIRKVNLRDQASDVGGASATLSRRILRVGVPYNDTREGGPPDRGLLFLSIQASIEDQFEFLQARWINSHVRPRGPGGNDMIVGRGERSCVIFGQDFEKQEVRFKTDFVTMTGGGYFFVPSIPTLRALLRGDPLPA